MAKFYLHQLRNGKMLVFEDGIIKVEETGYPLPDCVLPVGSKEYKGQEKILAAILGYSIESHSEFANIMENFEEMTFDEFKLKVQAENIGGGCPQRIQIIARDCTVSNISYIQSTFKHLIPDRFTDDSCILPETQDIIDEYGDILSSWKYLVNNPNQVFRNNIIMYLGVRHFTKKHIDLLRDAYAICVHPDLKGLFMYISVITSENGTSAILLLDSVSNNVDLEYFYATISGVDLSDGNIIVEDTEDEVDISFNCVEPKLEKFYSSTKHFRGSVKHFSLGD